MIETTSITIAIPVGDLEKATRWYAELLEDQPEIEPVRGIREFEVRPGTWLQLVAGPGRPGDAVFRMGVDDIHRERSRLLALGLQVSDIQNIDDVIDLCDFTDPWGNQLSLYHVLS